MLASNKFLICLLSMILILQSSCKKDDDCIDQNEISDVVECMDSLFVSYETMVLRPTAESENSPPFHPLFSCLSREQLFVSFQCDTVAIARIYAQQPRQLELVEETEDYKYFTASFGEYSLTYHNLQYFPCNDSIAFEVKSGIDESIWYLSSAGNPEGACPTGVLNNFEASLCDQGPEYQICFSCPWRLQNLIAVSIPSVVVANPVANEQSLKLRIPVEYFPAYVNNISLTIPSDESLSIIPGRYWLGDEIPEGDFQIERFNDSFFFHDVDFESGLLTVTEVNGLYLFSFNFKYCYNGVWTGYFMAST